MPTRIFAIKWDDDLGPLWMNKIVLRLCLESREHVGPRIKLEIGDITGHVHTCKPVSTHLNLSSPDIVLESQTEKGNQPMVGIKSVIAAVLGLVLFFGNLFYRIYFVPEVIGDVAIQQMDRAHGDTPAILMRAHTELADEAAFVSCTLFLIVVLALFSPEIAKTLRPPVQGAPKCGENGSSDSP